GPGSPRIWGGTPAPATARICSHPSWPSGCSWRSTYVYGRRPPSPRQLSLRGARIRTTAPAGRGGGCRGGRLDITWRVEVVHPLGHEVAPRPVGPAVAAHDGPHVPAVVRDLQVGELVDGEVVQPPAAPAGQT